MIEIATKKTTSEDYGNKHKLKAKLGWYRYDTRFGIPVYNELGYLERYNIFSARMLIRCDADGKLYLYDFVRTKKETSSPFEQWCYTVVNFVSIRYKIRLVNIKFIYY